MRWKIFGPLLVNLAAVVAMLVLLALFIVSPSPRPWWPLLVALACFPLSWLANRRSRWLTLRGAGVKARNKGNYRLARAKLSEALEACRGFSEGDCRRALVWGDLGELDRLEADYPRAEKNFRRTLEAMERKFGPGSKEAVAVLNNLGLVLADCGRFAEAEAVFGRLRQTVEAIFKPAQKSYQLLTATYLNNLGRLRRDQRRLDEAETLIKESLALMEKCTPPGHFYRATIRINLATVLRARGDGAGVLRLADQVIPVFERHYGPRHAYSAVARSVRADALRLLGRPAEAKDESRDALRDVERALGPDHPAAAECLHTQALLALGAGKPDRAEELCREALEIREGVFGRNHPRVAESLAVLAEVERARGREAEAENWLAQSVRAWGEQDGIRPA